MQKHSILIFAIVAAVEIASIGLQEAKGQTSWEPTGAIPRIPERSSIIDIAADNEGNVFAISLESTNDGATSTIRFYRSTDNGTSWKHHSDSIYSVAVGIDGAVWCGTQHGLFRSSDKGETWNAVAASLFEREIISGINIGTDGEMVITAPGTPQQKRFYISLDNGESWYSIETESRGQLGSFCLGNNGNRFYTASEHQGYLHFSFSSHSQAYEYRGKQTNQTTANIEYYVYNLVYNNRKDMLFMSSSSGSNATGDKISRSSDEGFTWRDITPINEALTGSMLVTSEGGLIVATKSDGVFFSSDNGNQWKNVSWGLPLPHSYTITVVTENRNNGMFLGLSTADGAQIFRTTLPSSVKESRTLDQRLSIRVRPTASNHSTIEYTLPSTDYISLTIYDPLGRTVRRLTHDRQSAGTHSDVWDGNDDRGLPAPQGAYLIVLQTRNQGALSTMTTILH